VKEKRHEAIMRQKNWSKITQTHANIQKNIRSFFGSFIKNMARDWNRNYDGRLLFTCRLIILLSSFCTLLRKHKDRCRKLVSAVLGDNNIKATSTVGWFDVAVAAFVTSTKLLYVEPG